MKNINKAEIQKLSVAGSGQHYQSFPESIKNILDLRDVSKDNGTKGHYEKERFDFIKEHINFSDLSILDIGANQGYFSLEALAAGASFAHIIEGRKGYTDFLDKIMNLMGYNALVENKFLDFSQDLKNKYYDVIFNLNVIHHLGGDFGAGSFAKQQALKEMAATFNHLIDKCRVMVFSMGFNWKGDEGEPLFERGTKTELIEFIKKSIQNSFSIKVIGIPDKSNGKVKYKILDQDNIERDDSLGEFLNRPLFILGSLYK